ncbi:MAG: S46 family peptidase [Bacteroidales bacterium]|nr:S46 family peptidase [Bacteroidales bacterium]
MKKIISLTILSGLLFFANITNAGEGIWLPILLEQLNEAEMQEMGMKISAEDIYSINHSSLKDAIVRFGGGCTAEIISDEGLLLTNHHCGFGSIQRHSSLEHDYLTNGFWAMNRTEELSNPGLTVTMLVRMEDVTLQVLEGVNDEMTEVKRDSIINDHIKKINEEAIKDTHYEAKVKPFYYGNEYYLFVSETFKDIRLVGAPPSNIGKFGGDTDNWMWPRHTGDFSMFRIYVDSSNNPAEYSENNVPYKPKYHIPISLNGFEKGDFTFVFGYPGRTQEYLPSFAIKMITQIENPARINLREKRLDIMQRSINKSDLVRIQYASKYAGVSNYWKKMIGENRGIKKLDAINKKVAFENNFVKWADETPERNKKYGNLIPEFEKIYSELTPIKLAMDYLIEAGFGLEIVRYAGGFTKLINASKDKETSKENIASIVEKLCSGAENHFKNYQINIDKETLSELLKIYYDNLDKKYLPSVFNEIENKFDANFNKYADYVFKKSFMTSENNVDKFLDKYKIRKYRKIEKDPAYELISSFRNYYYNNLSQKVSVLNAQLDSMQRIYMKAQMEMQNNKRFYPDANSTLRVHYGNIGDYYPRDAVHYKYYTTLSGIMEKEDPDIYDYVIEEKLKELYQNKDYGKYGDSDGTMHVCFTATNHTTGGNSGSPVMNAEGQLIGINFDRNWEGTMSDLMYDPDQCRNISLDIRYCLFIIDKFAGAGHLVDEMTIMKD